MGPFSISRSDIRANTNALPNDPESKPESTSKDRLRSSIKNAVIRVAEATHRAHLFTDDDIQTMVRRITDYADCSPPEYERLAAAGILLDDHGWGVVNDYLVAKGHQPVAQDLIDRRCDPLVYGLATAQPKLSMEDHEAMARDLRGKAGVHGETLSLRDVLRLKDGPEKLARLHPIGLHALLGSGPLTEVVLPLFPDRTPGVNEPIPRDYWQRNFNRNGPDAAAVINKIHSVAPGVTRVNISAGRGPANKVLTVDLSALVTPCPEVTIRVKESIPTIRMEIDAPEGVVIKVVSDEPGSGSKGFEPIEDVRVRRSTGRHEVELFRFDGGKVPPQYVRVAPPAMESPASTTDGLGGITLDNVQAIAAGMPSVETRDLDAKGN